MNILSLPKKRGPSTALFKYESAKQDWIEEHPNATPQQYEQAMQELARQFNV